MKSDWQKDKASRCPCRGADEWCGCQNENPADYLASVKGDLPPKVMVWRSQPMAHIGTWATTRYPVEAVAYVPEATLSAAMELPEVKDVLTLLTEARADLETYVNADYPASTCAEYPDIARRHARDMELCRRIDAALAAIKETKA